MLRLEAKNYWTEKLKARLIWMLSLCRWAEEKQQLRISERKLFLFFSTENTSRITQCFWNQDFRCSTSEKYKNWIKQRWNCSFVNCCNLSKTYKYAFGKYLYSRGTKEHLEILKRKYNELEKRRLKFNLHTLISS